MNVLRMVGRCLVCSRLISTWVSSLEPPPSTPSIVPHQRSRRRCCCCYYYYHHHQRTTTTDTIATRTTARFHHRRIHLSRAAQSSRPFHMSHLVPSRIPASRLAPAGASGDSPLFAFSFRRRRPHPRSSPNPYPLSPLASLSPSHRSSILGALFCLALSIPRASPSRSPGTRGSSPLSRREHLSLPPCLRRARTAAPFSFYEFVSRRGRRKIVHPTCLDSPLLRLSSLGSGNLRVQSTRPSARRYEFHTEFRGPGCGRGHRDATRHDAPRRIASTNPRDAGDARDKER